MAKRTAPAKGRSRPRPRYRSGKSLTSITAWRRFATHRIIYVIIAVLFALGMVVYFGSGPSGPSDSGLDEAMGATLVTVNDEPVSRSEFESAWQSQRRQYGFTSENDARSASMQGMLLSQLVDRALLRSLAKKRGLSVSDDAVSEAIAELRAQIGTKEKPATDQQLLGMAQVRTMDDLRENLKRDLVIQALARSLGGEQKLTEDDLLKSYDQARVRHILIAVAGGRASAPGALPDAQARKRAEQILAQIKAGGDFARLANEYTMDPSNKVPSTDPKTKRQTNDLKGGLMEMAPLSRYVPEFAEAARKLEPGQVSEPVKTDFGYHIIKMEEKKRELPADFAKNKTQLLNNLRETRGSEELGKLLEENRPKATVKWVDPGMQWRYELGRMYSGAGETDPDKAQKQLIEMLSKYVKDHPEDSAAGMVLGQTLYTSQYLAPPPAKPQDAAKKSEQEAERARVRDQIIAAYAQGLRNAEDHNVRLTLAELHLDADDKEKALEQYKRLARLLSYDDNPDNRWLHQRLMGAFTKLGETELAKEQQKKLDAIALVEKRREEERKAEEARRKEEDAKVAAQKKIDDARLKALREKQGTSAPAPTDPGAAALEGAITLPPGGSAATGGAAPAPGSP